MSESNNYEIFLEYDNGFPNLNPDDWQIQAGYYQYRLGTPHYKTVEEAEEKLKQFRSALQLQELVKKRKKEVCSLLSRMDFNNRWAKELQLELGVLNKLEVLSQENKK